MRRSKALQEELDLIPTEESDERQPRSRGAQPPRKPPVVSHAAPEKPRATPKMSMWDRIQLKQLIEKKFGLEKEAEQLKAKAADVTAKIEDRVKKRGIPVESAKDPASRILFAEPYRAFLVASRSDAIDAQYLMEWSRKTPSKALIQVMAPSVLDTDKLKDLLREQKLPIEVAQAFRTLMQFCESEAREVFRVPGGEEFNLDAYLKLKADGDIPNKVIQKAESAQEPSFSLRIKPIKFKQDCRYCGNCGYELPKRLPVGPESCGDCGCDVKKAIK